VPLTSRLEQLRDDLAVVDDPQERLMLLVDRARRFPALPPADRIEANRVRACVSVVWLSAEARDGVCTFRGDAESPVVRALVVLLCEFFSGLPSAVIAASDHDPLEALGVTDNLSPTRRNGLAATRQTIRDFARRQTAAAADTSATP
jgi:cysteine desulfuration protein SufE